MRTRFRALSVLAVVALAVHVAPAQDFESIPATELRDRPQRYWARGFVVQDTLVAHAGEDARSVGERRAFPFRTEILGDCYVDHQLRDILNGLELGKPYLFAGTVYQERRGFFSRDLRYTIVIKRITVTMDASAELAQRLAAEAAARGSFAETFASMDRVLTAAQQDLLAYATSSNVAMEALFEAGSPHVERVSHAVRQALTRNEIESRVPMVEFLARIMTGLLAERNNALAPAAEPAPAERAPEEAEMEDAVTTEETVAAMESAPVVEMPSRPEPAPVVETAAPVDELEAMDREEVAAADPVIEEGPSAPVLPVLVPVVEPEPAPAEEPAPEYETEVESEIEAVPLPPARLPPARIDIDAPLPRR